MSGLLNAHYSTLAPDSNRSSANLGLLTLGKIVRHPMRAYYWPILSGLLLGSSAFLPWITVGEQQYGGIPDVTAFWVLGLAVVTVILASLSIATRKNSRHPLLIVGLLGNRHNLTVNISLVFVCVVVIVLIIIMDFFKLEIFFNLVVSQ